MLYYIDIWMSRGTASMLALLFIITGIIVSLLGLLVWLTAKTHGVTARESIWNVLLHTLDPGVIFVLKNRNDGVNIDNLNRIHPFYMVYIRFNGEIVCDYLNPKKLLDSMRLLCKGMDEPIREVYQPFNQETDDGRDMSFMSKLLNDAIESIIHVKADSDIDSLFRSGGTTALLSEVSGIDDFELICFLVVK